MNFKKLFASALSVLMLATMVPTTVLGAGSYSDELEGAYEYAYDNGITTMSSIENANMYGSLTRVALAKMISNFATTVMSLELDTDKECSFPDVSDDLDAQYDNGVTAACQLNLMGVGIDMFNPYGIVSRAEFGTVLSRVLRGDKYNGGIPYYMDHLNALEDVEIMNDISNPTAKEIRGYVMLMMQRADESGEAIPATCKDPMVQIACALNPEDDSCPVECRDDVIDETTNGELDVAMDSIAGGDIPAKISSLPVVTYEFTADEDVRIDSLVLKRLGYFSDATVKYAALFIDGGRISKVASFSTSSDEATVTIANGYEVKAGETVKMTIHVAVGDVAAGNQFSVKLLSVSSTAADVNLASNLTSETFKTVDADAPTVTYANGSSVENPKVGEISSDLFEFTLNVPTSSELNDYGTLKSITFKDHTGTIDEGTELENFKLVVDGTTVATADGMVGKYLIFNLEDGYQIKEGKTPTFTVKADVIGGASDYVNFIFDNAMDLVVIGDKQEMAMNVAGAGIYTRTVQVSAGKITLNRTNPSSTDLLGNKDNVFLGSFEIVNNAGESLKLSTLGLNMAGTAISSLDTVKVRLGSTTASPIELTSSATGTLWTETSIEKAIGSKLIVYVYADTIETGMDSKTLQMSLTANNTSKFLVEESSNDNDVTDLSPNTLTWTQMIGKDAGLTLTNVILGNKTVAEGTYGVEALDFKVKASSAYGLKLKKLTFTSATVDSDTIAGAKLFRGTTEIPATVKVGSIVVDDDITIAKGETAEFILKLDIQNNPEVTGFAYSLVGSTGIEAEDTSEDKNTVTSNTTITGRTITVTTAGEIVAAYESTADNNKYAKNILAGNTAVVSEYSLYSKYEEINVGKAVVTFDSTNVNDSVLDVQLRYDGTQVASDPVWTATGSVATFDDIDFDTSMTKAPLLVKVVSKVINDDGGATFATKYVTSISLDTLKGKDSGDDITVSNLGDDSKNFGIVPVTVNPTVATVGASIADLGIVAAVGSNTTTGGVVAKGTLSSIVFTLEGSNGIVNKIYVKDSDNTTLGSGALGADGDYTVTFAKEVTEGTTTLKVTTSLTGSTVNPSYSISVKTINYYTNVDGAGTSIDARFGGSKTLLVK